MEIFLKAKIVSLILEKVLVTSLDDFSLDNNSDLQHDIFNTFFRIKSGLIVAKTPLVWFCAFYGNLESNINSM